MSVLNQTSDGLFNVLIVLVRVIIRFGPRSREDLQRACGGVVESLNISMLTNTLNRWEELGLFEIRDGMVSLADPYRAALGSTADVAEERLPKVARTIALTSDNNLRFWETASAKSADLSRGIAWMLAQDIYELDTTTNGLQERETRQFRRQNQHDRAERYTLERSAILDGLPRFRSRRQSLADRSHRCVARRSA